ncbi:putative metal-dependent hydrolase [Duganella sp. 1411]|nr:SprT family zinc-dependent metalloprotease [Duganella sp. 1411]MBP1206666.1 putative metal-dependent hydrolase [Duganella sp. 1411]
MVKPASPKDDASQLDLFGREAQSSPKPVYTSPVWSVPPSSSKPPPVSPYVAPPETAVPVKPRQVAPPPSDPTTAKRQLMVGEFILEYDLRRSTRRSIGFMIDDDGLRVTAPKRISIAEIDNAIRTKQHWILSKLKERRERRAARLQKPPVEWIDGAQLPYLGADITLRLLVGGRNRTSYNPATRELSMVLVPGATETLLKERVKSWYQQEAKVLFEQRLDLYAARLGVSYHSFGLSSAGTRWGSCTVDRKIRLNWKLIHFSLPLIDYVVAHELAHTLEMNHSADFWNTVGRIYPEYDEAKNLLRKRAQELPVLFA